MPLIGTAGHVDHGKSTLIERLTGRDPDRWREEKERGLTIDLGFAWAELPSGLEVSFVDVPGHERYMKNMLAGVEAIDTALLVVAADEGWMPQTEEHVAALDVLDVKSGVVALTKIDSVDEDLAELALLEVEERLTGTSLEGSKVIPVSAVSGKGIDELVDELDGLATSTSPRDRNRPRMWIDRSFPISGAGTVVTGTLLGGSVSVDDVLTVFPQMVEARVRGLQSHEKDHQTLGPGRRVALNLGGVDHDQVRRGDMLGVAVDWDTTTRFSTHLRTARYVDEITEKGAYAIHVGSATQQASITGTSSGSAVITVDSPLALTAGDRFVLRDTGRKLIVGGGRVVDVAPGATRESLSAADGIPDGFTEADVAELLLRTRRIDSTDRLARHSGGATPPGGYVAGTRTISRSFAEELMQKAAREVEDSHRTHPLRIGLPLATLAERLGVDPGTAEQLVADANLSRRGPDVALPDFEPKPTDEQESDWQEAATRLAEGLDVPSESELGLDPEVVALKVRESELVRVAPGLVYLPQQVDELKAIVTSFEDEFTVAEFRDRSKLSRKYAVPILEWTDREGLTVRRGDRRGLR